MFDTNVLISVWLLPNSKPRQALDRALQKITACRDSKHDKVLELAVSGHATYIMTGDSDLLALNPFQGIQIVRPQELLKN